MMKKQGFTLAEVLITLTIIGVVAVLTLPALMTNTQEQQAKTALRKMANTISNTASLSAATLGFDYASVDEASTDAEANEQTRSIANILRNTAKVKSINTDDIENITNGIDMEILFNDGTSLLINSAEDTDALVQQDDGHMRGFRVIFDTNGPKGPNQVSNCAGAGGVSGVDAFTADSRAQCDTKGNRNIRDRFMMNIRNDFVAPVGAASAWALNDARDADISDFDLNAGA